MTENLFTAHQANLPDELFTTLLEANNVRIERIVSHGQSSPKDVWYHQNQHEWVRFLF
jgi:cupin 2 domain-containing protein